MDDSSDSLLDRLRRGGSSADWTRFVDLYGPILQPWARRLSPSDEADDLVQDVFIRVKQKLSSFVGEENESFLAWLRTVMLNRWRDLRDKAARRPCTGESAALEAAPAKDELGELDAAADRKLLIARALQIMQRDFEPTTWRACWESVVADRPAAEVAAELGVTEEVVYSATYRVIRRLRQELAGGWH